MLLRALEHEMFEEMRDTGLADRIVRRTVAVPHHVGHDRNAVIRDHHDVEAVVQGEGRQIRAAAFRPPERGGVGAKDGLRGRMHDVSTLAESSRLVPFDYANNP